MYTHFCVESNIPPTWVLSESPVFVLKEIEYVLSIVDFPVARLVDFRESAGVEGWKRERKDRLRVYLFRQGLLFDIRLYKC